MRRINDFARVLVLVLLALAPAGARAAGGYIFDATGSVSVAVGKNPPRLASINDSVVTGTVIRTGDKSTAVLKFEDGQVVSMQANSTFHVREYRFEPRKIEESSVLFSMFKGGMRFITGEIGQRNKGAFRLATPHATIGIRGTDFLVAMANNATYSQVITGSITATNAAGVAVITAGQTALTSSATALTTTVPAASVPAGAFSQVAALPVPPAVPGPLPPPPAAGAAVSGSTAATGTTATTANAAAATTTAATSTAAGGAAAGGAAASAAASGGLIAGVSATTIGIGLGVAAVAAAVINSSTTQH